MVQKRKMITPRGTAYCVTAIRSGPSGEVAVSGPEEREGEGNVLANERAIGMLTEWFVSIQEYSCSLLRRSEMIINLLDNAGNRARLFVCFLSGCTAAVRAAQLHS